MQRRALFSQKIRLNPSNFFRNLHTEDEDSRYIDVPKPQRRRSERKPYPTAVNVLIRRAREERKARKADPCKLLDPPENGLLVPELVEVAHRVWRATESLLSGLSKLVGNVVPVKRCRFCTEVHIGDMGHEIRTCMGHKSGLRSATHVWRNGGIEDVVHFPYCYHLADRVGKPRIGHREKSTIQKLPAIVELCIQAGLDLENYPTKRRTKPVYSIEGRIIDFEPEIKNDEIQWISVPIISGQGEEEKSLSGLSEKTMESWFQMRLGARRIMEKYSVITCGYCSEVQVGPKGHKVRDCRAAKHQFRNGLHAWQEATIDDLVGPNYVWHVRNPCGAALAKEIKRYYGKAPAIIELCVQAGAPVPAEYQSMMRLDVVWPGRDEIDLVA